jgi:RHS repeat-associated protein
METKCQGSQVDVLGVANPTATVTVRVVGGTTFTAARKGEYYHHALNVGNNVYPQIEVKSLYGATQAQTNRVFNPSATETFTHDADGNLTQDGRWTYTWDGENRLIEMKRESATPAGARLRLVFEYDHQGRRIRKQFYTHNGSSWILGSDIAFAYDGWNLVAELNAASSNTRLRTYHWGLDLSGTEQGPGGVGGLWLVTDHTSGTVYHWPVYDGNGNVAALVAQANGSLSARYEYSPFGETLRATGSMAKQNPFRFSTKYTDNETGLLYYGYRYYDPVTGRWPNRDPIGERGGANLHGIVDNNPITKWDLLGNICGIRVGRARLGLYFAPPPKGQEAIPIMPGLVIPPRHRSELESTFGHEWIEFDDGSAWGFAPGQNIFIDAYPGALNEGGVYQLDRYWDTECVPAAISTYTTPVGYVAIGRSGYLTRGSGAPKACDCAICPEIIDCLSEVAKEWQPKGYNLFTQNCRHFVADALRRCGLRKSE